MSKLVLSAWILTAVCLIAAVAAVLVRPLHWERTVVTALVVAIAAASVAVLRSRRPSRV